MNDGELQPARIACGIILCAMGNAMYRSAKDTQEKSQRVTVSERGAERLFECTRTSSTILLYI